MALLALTNIKHGADDGTMIFVDAGEQVDESLFPEEVIQDLLAAEAIVEAAVVTDVIDLQNKIAELQAQIDQMQSDKVQLTQVNDRRVDQTALDPQAGVPAGTLIDEDGNPAGLQYGQPEPDQDAPVYEGTPQADYPTDTEYPTA